MATPLILKIRNSTDVSFWGNFHIVCMSQTPKSHSPTSLVKTKIWSLSSKTHPLHALPPIILSLNSCLTCILLCLEKEKCIGKLKTLKKIFFKKYFFVIYSNLTDRHSILFLANVFLYCHALFYSFHSHVPFCSK